MMKEIIRIDRDDCVLVAIDYQAKLLPAMEDSKTIEKNTVKLAKGLATIGIPKIVTTQYSKGLGQTTEEVAEALGDFDPVDKASFSAYGDENFRKRLEESKKKDCDPGGHRNSYMCGTDGAGSSSKRISGSPGSRLLRIEKL